MAKTNEGLPELATKSRGVILFIGVSRHRIGVDGMGVAY